MNRKGSSQNQSNPQKEVQGQNPSAQDRFWVETAKQLTDSSIPAIEEGAKQLINLVTLLQGIFFAVLTMSDLKTKLVELIGTSEFWFLLVLILIPLSCWVVSLWLSILVFVPRSYSLNLNSPDLSRETFIKIVEYKHRRLLQAYTALASGFIPLMIAIIIYLIT